MFEYEGFEYSLEEVTEAAKQKDLQVEDYISKFGLKKIAEQEVTEPELGKTSDTVAKGATVVSETGQAPETEGTPEITGFKPADTSLGSRFIDSGIELEGFEFADGIGLASVQLPEVVVTADQYKNLEQQIQNEGAKNINNQEQSKQQLLEEQVAKLPKTEPGDTPFAKLVNYLSKKGKEDIEETEDITAAKSVYGSTVNSLVQLSGVDDRADYLLATLIQQVPDDVFLNILGEDAGRKAIKSTQENFSRVNKQIDNLNSLNLPTLGFTDIGQKEGFDKITTGFAAFFNGVTSVGTSVITSVSTGGVGLATDMLSTSVKDFNDTKAESLGITVEELFASGQGEILTPAAIGAVGYSLERFGIKGVTKYINRMGNKASKSLFAFLNTGNKEGGTEWAQGGLEEFNKAIASGLSTDEAAQKAWEYMTSSDGLENYLQGFAGGSGSGVLGRAAKNIRSKNENEALSESINRLNELENSKYRKNLSAEDLSVINTAQDEIRFNLRDIVNKSNELVGTLTDKQIADLNANTDFITSSADRINEIENSTAYTDQEKQVLIDAVNKQREIASQNIFNIRNEADKLQGQIETVKGISGLVKGLKVEEADTAADAEKFAEDNNLDIKSSTSQGYILQNPETGEQTIVINKETALNEQAVNVAAHEFLHAVLFNTVKDSPQTAINLGNALLSELNKIDPAQVKDSNFKKRMEQYNDQTREVKMEEALTLFSDAVATGDIKFNENVFTKLGDRVRRVAQKFGVNIKFNTGRDVYNFIKDYNKSIEKGDLSLAQVKAAAGRVEGELITPATEQQAEQIIKESKAVNDLAVQYKNNKEDMSEQDIANLQDQYQRLGIDALQRWAKQKGVPLQVDENVISDINNQFESVMKNYTPTNRVTGKPMQLSTYVGNILGRRVGPKIVEDYTRRTGQSTITQVVEQTQFADETAEQAFEIEERAQAEKLGRSKLIDVRKNPRVKRVLPTLEKEIKLTEGDSSVEILNNNRSKFTSEIYNIPEGKIEKVDNLTYSKNKPETSELGRIQQDFSNAQETERSIKTMPEFNVTTMESTITEQGERIPVSPEVRGRSMKIGQTVLDFFYEPYIDPASQSTDPNIKAMAITNKSGRSKGKTTQTKVYRLKPEFRPNKQGKISPQAVSKAREWAGVDVDLNELSKNERRNYATKLAAWARMRGGQVALSVADKSLPESAPKQQRADTRAGRSRLMFSENIDSNVEDDRFSQIYFAYERGETLSDKDKQIVEDYIAKQALEESDKGKSALQFTKAMKASDLSSDLKEGTWTLSDKKFKEDQNALKKFDKQADNLSSQIPLTANIANKNRNIVLGLFAGHYNIVGSDMAKIGSDFKQGVLSNLNTDESSVLSEDTLKRWKNFPWDDLKSSYASENYTGLRKINESNSLKEQQAIARETFNTKQGKASLELYDLWNTTLQEWLYSSEPGSKEFNYKANYILKLKKSNASIGTTGERILAPPGYVFLPGKAINGTVKFEHLKSSSQQSSESALLVLQNKWKDKGEDNIKAYNGIWGLLDDFNIIDEQTGKVNDSSIFRFAENLELAKSIYSVESNFTKTLYDDIVKKVGEKSVKQFESDQNKLFNANNNKLPITVKLSKSKGTPEVLKTMEDLDVKAKDANKAYFDSADLDKGFNDILEQTTGIASEKRYKRVKAEVAGAARGRVFRGIPYSAQDLVGLLYETLSKGKLGDAQMAWWTENLLKPYAKAMNDIDASRLAMMDDYRALKKELKLVPKDLRKKIPGEPFTREQAVRVYIWNQQGMEVPGISEADLKDLTNYVDSDRELQVFANQLIAMQKGDEYAKPKEGWPAGSITTDLLESINTVKRAKYLEQWQANVDVMFSEENMNKLEAAYGKKYRKAMENMLRRMKTGRNRSFSDDSLTGRFTDWLQGSVGAIMFFNTRSAVLQTLSSVNFINFTDNNPLAAAKAFANQKQYWSDVVELINSDFLKARRSGLRMNVNEADIADMAKQGGPRAVINKLLQLGFTPTQVADSFAIASGGATFYRNRIKTYKKQGLSQAEAETKAFEDFRENAEESQQSSRPDKISMQQAGGLGRLILAFQNTPSQYARIIDKSIRDLKNGRGDAKTNISKIVYYSTVQNLLFNALQQALFAFGFDEEEPEDEEKKEKYIGIANGMTDSLLRGTGLAGGIVSVVKNAILRIVKESEKDKPNYEKVGADLLKIAPPVSSKLSKINQAARSYKWDKDEMIEKGWSLDSPAYLAGANVVSALTNVPLDRAIKKANNVAAATDSDLETWERLALLGGWQDWEIGIEEENETNKPQPRKIKTRKIIKRKTIKK